MAKTTKKTTRKKAAKKVSVNNITEEVNKIVEADAEALPAPVAAEDTVTEITLAKFKKLFKQELKETADWLWREDKEGDFKNKKMLNEAALSFVIANHEEYYVTDRYE